MKLALLLLCAPALLASCGLTRPKPPEYPFEQLAEGLVVHDLLVPEEGPVVQMGDRLTLEYSIALADSGELVDSSADRGQPHELTLEPGAVFPGMERGLLGMRLLGRRELLVPAELGYGAAGLPPRIPPDAALRVTLEVLSLERPAD
jgi:FKBP-type peptidyl-prolyl cis-trans isomerase